MKTPMVVSDFRDGLKVGALLIQNCNDCNKPNMWPRYACPHCQSDNLGWVKSGGTGTLHSFCVLRQGAPEGFEDDLPYAIGVVKLAEGVQLLARLEACGEDDWSAYQCDDLVEFVSVDASEIERRPCATFRRVG
ncbi:MAG: Zn-ribbon domain-containing OB-fold protein [Sphingomonas sp.]|jgi:uncharacterized OB-fold protein